MIMIDKEVMMSRQGQATVLSKVGGWDWTDTAPSDSVYIEWSIGIRRGDMQAHTYQTHVRKVEMAVS